MIFRSVLAAAAMALLCACGGGQQAAVQDEALQRSLGAARTAYLQGQYELAIQLYQQARERARARDDQAALAVIAHDLGAAQLQKGDSKAALETARSALAETERRQVAGTAPLRLVEAAALYRLGRNREAAAAAQAAVADGKADQAVRARALFIEGLVSAEAGDLNGVERSLSQRPAAEPQSELAVDIDELRGWRALLAGDLGEARRTFLDAADGRRRVLDYRGMGRALAAAGEAAARQGDPAGATDLFLRAGRSAMIRGETAHARRWLGRAEALAERARKREMRDQARALIDEITN